MKSYQTQKSLILSFYDEIEAANANSIDKVIRKFTKPDLQWYGVYPFNEQKGGDAVAEVFWIPFLSVWSNVQRRQDIFLAGTSEIDNADWVISMGHFMGLLDGNWLGLPASRKIAFLRYADFNCIKDGKIIRSSFFCDLIGLMHQLGLNPLPLQTGASFVYPGPRTHDGLLIEPQDQQESQKTLKLVNQMIGDLTDLNKNENDCPHPDLLKKTWHDDMIWYGPAGIGASYTIPRYQEQHQFPFRRGLKDKVFNGHICRFAEGNYAGFFGWPNLTNTPIGGFLGLPASNIAADMRVVDIYRREGEKLSENWVLIDLPWWLKQQGVDVLERTKTIINY
ncbi:MAG: nuclear transport factor 2 family protein [SAR324 cluster bacterium]|nr:nuclear transport factor 2 family protein [SAR324 cluster bacterium]